MTIKIAAVGDISLGDYLICLGFGVRSIIERNNIDIFSDVQDILKKNDIVFGNLESVLSDQGKDETDPETLYIRGKKEFLPLLKQAGFNVLNVANNHIMQHEEKAFDETVKLLESENICVIGKKSSDGRTHSDYMSIDVKGVCLGFLAYNLVPELYCKDKDKIRYAAIDLEGILSDVRQSVNRCTHLVVSLHWGLEYMRYPSKKMKEWAMSIIDCGARIILGHHPHVLQGIEHYKNGLIVYSMGNFVFDLIWHRRNQESMIVEVELDQEKIVSVDRQYVEIDIKTYVPRIKESREEFVKLDKKLRSAHHSQQLYQRYYKVILCILFLKKLTFMIIRFHKYDNVFRKYFFRKKILRRK